MIRRSCLSEIAQHFLDELLFSHFAHTPPFELQRVVRTLRTTCVLMASVHLTEECGCVRTFSTDRYRPHSSGLQCSNGVAEEFSCGMVTKVCVRSLAEAVSAGRERWCDEF